MRWIQRINVQEKDLGMRPEELYGSAYRNAMFAGAYEHEGRYYAFTDHLGNVPMFYRRREDGTTVFSSSLDGVVMEGDALDPAAARHFAAFLNAKVVSPIAAIRRVPPGTMLEIDPRTGSARTIFTYRFRTKGASTEALETLLRDAIRRTAPEGSAGILLSGGIDSALVGFFLKESGVRLRAYTFSAWKSDNEEMERARFSAEAIGVESHEIVSLSVEDVPKLLDAHAGRYGGPNGCSAGLGVLAMLEKSGLSRERQAYFAQNVDTMTCSVPAQYFTYFASLLPRGLRRLVSRSFGHGAVSDEYLSLVASGLVTRTPEEFAWVRELPPHQQLKLLGMLIAHTPSDGEVIHAPLRNAGIAASNPYYDIDLIEHCLVRPVWPSFRHSRRSPFRLAIEKTEFQELASKRLPAAHIRNKKGFAVPMSKREDLRKLQEKFPSVLDGIRLTPEQRFPAEILRRYAEKKRIVIAPDFFG